MSKMFVFVVSFVKAGCLFHKSHVFGLFAPPQTAVSCSLICLVLCSVYFIVQLVLKSKSRSFTHSFWPKRAHIQVEAKNTTQRPSEKAGAITQFEVIKVKWVLRMCGVCGLVSLGRRRATLTHLQPGLIVSAPASRIRLEANRKRPPDKVQLLTA